MLFQAARDYLVRLDHTIFVGDDLRDCQTATNAGWASIFIGNPDDLIELIEEQKPLSVFPSLMAALDTIRNFYLHNQLGPTEKPSTWY